LSLLSSDDDDDDEDGTGRFNVDEDDVEDDVADDVADDAEDDAEDEAEDEDTGRVDVDETFSTSFVSLDPDGF